MSKNQFHSATIDYSNLKEALLNQKSGTAPFKEELYLAEIGQYPELKEFYQFISSAPTKEITKINDSTNVFVETASQEKTQLSTEDKKKYFVNLMASLANLSPILSEYGEIKFKPEFLKYSLGDERENLDESSFKSEVALKEERKKYLEAIQDMNVGSRQLGSVVATASLSILDESKTREQIFNDVDTKYNKFLEDAKYQSGKDINRGIISFRKNGNSYIIKGSDLTKDNAQDIESVVDNMINAIKQLNEEKSLGLTNEQIGYIAYNNDQFIKGAGTTWQTNSYMDQEKTISFDPNLETLLVNITDNIADKQTVKMFVNEGYKISSIANIEKQQGQSYTTIMSDISALTDNQEFRPGLGSNQVRMTMSISTFDKSAKVINLEPPKALKIAEAANTLETFARVRVAAKDNLDNKENQLAFLASTHEELVPYTIEAIDRYNSIGKDAMIDLFVTSSLNISKKSNQKLNLDQVANELVKSVKSLSIAEAKLEFYNQAQSQQIETDASSAYKLYATAKSLVSPSKSRSSSIDSLNGGAFLGLSSSDSGKQSPISQFFDGQKTPESRSSRSSSSASGSLTSSPPSRKSSVSEEKKGRWVEKVSAERDSPVSSKERKS